MRLNRRVSGKRFSVGRLLAAVTFLVLAGSALLTFAPARPAERNEAAPLSPSAVLAQPASSPARTARLETGYGSRPLAFEANEGQSDANVKFLVRGAGYTLFLTKEQAVLALQSVPAKSGARNVSVVRMALTDANPSPAIIASDELPGKSNYLIGDDPSQWHRNVPEFARVRYHDVYPGIDLVYYGNQGHLEYDFEVAPGADPNLVSMLVQTSAEQGFEGLQLNEKGDLLVASADGSEVRLAAPRVYQKVGSEKKAVDGRFALRADGRVGFGLGSYDHSRVLVIDPVLSYSTYLGGSGAESCSTITGAQFTPGCPSIAVDSAANAYIAGATTSTDFPFPSGGAASHIGGGGAADVFVTKFDNTGTVQLFTTYLGGSGIDSAAGIAVDSGFFVVVAGTTNSTDFPVTNGAYQQSPESSGNKHVFVTRLDPTGSALEYSTYLSGNGIDVASGVALDLLGKIYVTGTTTSTDAPSSTVEFPATVGGFQTSSMATNQFFMAKVDPIAIGVQSVPYSTYFGGGNPTNGVAVGGGIAVDRNGNAYITGGTNFLHIGISSDFPILNALQGCLDTPEAVAPTTAPNCSAVVTAMDAFVAKINPAAASGAQLQYSTYFGGSGDEVGYGIAVDNGGAAYITGYTTSGDMALGTAAVPYQAGSSGGKDVFVVKLGAYTPPATTSTTPTAVTLIYSSYLGGSADEVGTAIAADSVGGARITGWTESPNLLTQNAVQATPGGGRDAFVANLDTTASQGCTPGPGVHCATNVSYLGGNGTDMGTGIAVDSQGASYVVGETASGSGFPLLSAFQSALSGPSDAFVARLNPQISLSMTATAAPSPVGVGNQVTFKYLIANLGDVASQVTFTDNYSVTSPNASFVSATATPGNCGTQVNGGAVQCNLGTLSTTASGATAATVTIVLTPTPSTTTTPQVPPPTPPPLGNSGTVSVPGTAFQASATATATVNDFALTVGPASQTVAAGGFASYTVNATPTGAIPSSVTLAASSGLPTGATATFSTNPFPNLANGPVSSVLNINTTARVTTTVERWRRGGPFYAAWLPVSGLAFLGLGIGGTLSRKRRLALGLLLGGFLTLILLQAGCGTTTPFTTTTGTPAGTYTVTVTASTGSATRTTTVQLVVQ